MTQLSLGILVHQFTLSIPTQTLSFALNDVVKRVSHSVTEAEENGPQLPSVVSSRKQPVAESAGLVLEPHPLLQTIQGPLYNCGSFIQKVLLFMMMGNRV